MDIVELPICQQKWLDIGNSIHPILTTILRSIIKIFKKNTLTFIIKHYKILKYKINCFSYFTNIQQQLIF